MLPYYVSLRLVMATCLKHMTKQWQQHAFTTCVHIIRHSIFTMRKNSDLPTGNVIVCRQHISILFLRTCLSFFAEHFLEPFYTGNMLLMTVLFHVDSYCTH